MPGPMLPLRVIIVLMFCLFVTGCTSTGSIFCDSEHPEPKIANLMKESCAGNRLAALQLGLWFEGHEQYPEAAHYFEIASTPSSGRNYLYVPPAGDVPGFTMPVDSGMHQDGLAEAQFRLGLLYLHGQGVGQNAKKAGKYFKLAAEQGHSGAVKALSQIPKAR